MQQLPAPSHYHRLPIEVSNERAEDDCNGALSDGSGHRFANGLAAVDGDEEHLLPPVPAVDGAAAAAAGGEPSMGGRCWRRCFAAILLSSCCVVAVLAARFLVLPSALAPFSVPEEGPRAEPLVVSGDGSSTGGGSFKPPTSELEFSAGSVPFGDIISAPTAARSLLDSAALPIAPSQPGASTSPSSVLATSTSSSSASSSSSFTLPADFPIPLLWFYDAVYRKLSRCEGLTIGLLGGSVSQGCRCSTVSVTYAGLLERILNTLFPVCGGNAPHRVINRAMGARGSDFPSLCFSQLFDSAVSLDVLILEHAANDVDYDNSSTLAPARNVERSMRTAAKTRNRAIGAATSRGPFSLSLEVAGVQPRGPPPEVLKANLRQSVDAMRDKSYLHAATLDAFHVPRISMTRRWHYYLERSGAPRPDERDFFFDFHPDGLHATEKGHITMALTIAAKLNSFVQAITAAVQQQQPPAAPLPSPNVGPMPSMQEQLLFVDIVDQLRNSSVEQLLTNYSFIQLLGTAPVLINRSSGLDKPDVLPELAPPLPASVVRPPSASPTVAPSNSVCSLYDLPSRSSSGENDDRLVCFVHAQDFAMLRQYPGQLDIERSTNCTFDLLHHPTNPYKKTYNMEGAGARCVISYAVNEHMLSSSLDSQPLRLSHFYLMSSFSWSNRGAAEVVLTLTFCSVQSSSNARQCDNLFSRPFFIDALYDRASTTFELYEAAAADVFEHGALRHYSDAKLYSLHSIVVNLTVVAWAGMPGLLPTNSRNGSRLDYFAYNALIIRATSCEEEA